MRKLFGLLLFLTIGFSQAPVTTANLPYYIGELYFNRIHIDSVLVADSTVIYIEGVGIIDTSLIGYLNQDEKILGDWDNTDVPWAENELVSTVIVESEIDSESELEALTFQIWAESEIDTSKIGFIDQTETVVGNWDFTANPHADNEVANDITANNYLLLTAVDDSTEDILNIYLCRNYDNPDDAITDIGTIEATLLVTETETCDVNFTVPATMNVKFERGGSWTIDNGVTVDFNGQLDAGLWQIFTYTGSGTISFDNSGLIKLYPEWWGAYTDNTHGNETVAAIEEAVAIALASHLPIYLSAGDWLINSEISVVSSAHHESFKLTGAGKGNTVIYNEVANGAVFRVNGASGVWKSVIFADLEITTATFPVASDCIYIENGTFGGGIYNIYFHGTDRGAGERMTGDAIVLSTGAIDVGVIRNYEVKNNAIEFFEGYGIYGISSITTTTTFNISIDNNLILDCKSGGIYGHFEQSVVSNNIIAYNGLTTSHGGVYIKGNDDYTIVVNLLEGNVYEHNHPFNCKIDKFSGVNIRNEYHVKVADGVFGITTTNFLILGGIYGDNAVVENCFFKNAFTEEPKTIIVIDESVIAAEIRHCRFVMLDANTKVSYTTSTNYRLIDSDQNLSSDIDLVFEGSTIDEYKTTIAITDPTADRTVTFPDLSGTLAYIDSPVFTTKISTPIVEAVGGVFQGLFADNATDVTIKVARLGAKHYTNAEEPIALIIATSTNTTNSIAIGGGSGSANTATGIDFFTATDNTTTTGTKRMGINSGGAVDVVGAFTANTIGSDGVITALTLVISDSAFIDTLQFNIIYGLDSLNVDSLNFVPDDEYTIDMGGKADTALVGYLAQNESITGNWINTTSPWAENELVSTVLVESEINTESKLEALSFQIWAESEIDTSKIGFIDQAETIAGNWDNTANPWAENEIVSTVIVESELAALETDPNVNTEAEIEAITGAYFGTSKVVTAGYIWVADGTDFESVIVGGDLTLASGGAFTIGHDVLDDQYFDAHADVDHNQTNNFVAELHFYQEAIDSVNTGLTGVLRSDSGVLSIDTDVSDLVIETDPVWLADSSAFAVLAHNEKITGNYDFTDYPMADNEVVADLTITSTKKISTIVASEQMRLGWDDVNFLKVDVLADGHTTFTTVDEGIGVEADIKLSPDGIIELDANVGIGIANPDGKLHVHAGTAGDITAYATADDLVIEGSTDTGLSILTPNVNTSFIILGSTGDSWGASMAWKHDDNLFSISSAKASASLILQSGNKVTAFTIDGNQNATLANNITVGNRTIYTPNALSNAGTSVADGAAITVTNRIMRMVGADVDALLDADPAINDGSADGEIVIIQGTADGNTVTIADNVNTQLDGGASVTLGDGDVICLMWDSNYSMWIEQYRSNN